MRTAVALLTAGMLAMGVAGARGDEETLDGVTWGYSVIDGVATVTSASPTSGNLTIPAMLGECPVKRIGDNAFYDCRDLMTVVIPAGVEEIGEWAFSSCTGLTEIDIPSSVTTIGRGAFGSCEALLEVMVPDGVTDIPDSMFGGCSELTTLYLPPSVTNIGYGAFYECASLEELAIPSGMTSIGYEAFYGFSGLKTLSIPSSVTEIGERAFEYCTGLTTVGIPNSVTNIGYSAFSGCTGLCEVVISENVTEISSYLFSGCDALRTVGIPQGVTNIESGAFYYCSALEEMVIPSNVVAIGDGAFEGCWGLRSVTIPQYVCTAGIRAVFPSACYSITNVTICEGTREIGTEAFYGCSYLTSVSIPNSVTDIGGEAFRDCYELTTVEIPGSVTNIGYRAFAGCARLEEVTLHSGLEEIGYGAFADCGGLRSLRLPGGVTDIRDEAFSGCSQLWSLELPDSVTNIESRAFYNCEMLWELTLPDSLEEIGYSAFQGCRNLERLSFGSGLKRIYDYAFAGCERLWEVSIPTNVTHVGERAFDECRYVTSVTIPQCVCSTSLWSIFASTYSLTNITICPGTTEIGDYAFDYCSELVSVSIPEGVESIGTNAFSGCYKLTELDIPDSVRTIGIGAFSGCGLKSVTIPTNVSSIAAWTFSSCSDLETVVIPDGVVSIGEYAFDTCRSLTEVSIPASVLDIQDEAFRDCTGLDRISIPNTVTNIGSGAFRGCTGLTSLTLPSSLESLGAEAFAGCFLSSLEIPDAVETIAGGTFSGCAFAHLSVPGSWRSKYVDGSFWSTYAGVPIECTIIYRGAPQDISFVCIGLQMVTNRVVLEAFATGEGELSFAVMSGPGVVTGNILTFTGPGIVVVRAWVEGAVGWADAEAWQTIAVFDGADPISLGAGGYLVVDMSEGRGATNWPVEYLDTAPGGGFNTDEYKTGKLVLRWVEAGTFMMGSPTNELGRMDTETFHEVTLTEGFWIGLFEVTQTQWELAMGSNPSRYPGAMRPVEELSYDALRGASAGSHWPGSKEVDPESFMGVLRAKTGLVFDLPTGAQWEYACRAGTTTALNSGKNLSDTYSCTNLAVLGRYSENWRDGKGGCFNYHTTVGSYAPNAWGLYDMHGNVREYCLDWYGAYEETSVTNPVGPTNSTGLGRVLRGGGHNWSATGCRSAARGNMFYPGSSGYDEDLGVRVSLWGKATQNVKFVAVGEQTATGRVELVATATGGGAVAFEVVSGPGSLSGNVLTFTGAGTVVVRALAEGNGIWDAAEATREIVAVEEGAAAPIPAADYEAWVRETAGLDGGAAPQSARGANGRENWENYVCDIAPGSTNELEMAEVELDEQGRLVFRVGAASARRWYSLQLWEDLGEEPREINLGRGESGMTVTNGDLENGGFSRLKVRLHERLQE